ncbi:integral membrane protein DUF106-domain-containing protein [Syncephalis pseudoplumigaleata]|uniref:ER membrane protein complex subunit 3 n=1 Tax=Syncephalis pseudoplumigaleata TaxID=1712513 RepID=A0A4P9Z4I5_9FUNG|nr:integral membrane protein DUF106-domain-containing protein [Syncephalis pseudoplumigaleata]|eukprot:RKP27493.1 integral membrane protein DUF106-domain-containing protein [Syncephalis pseudoplumigaleata]
MIMVGVLRHQVTLLIGGEPPKASLKAVKETKALARGIALRTSANHLPLASFNQRKTFLCKAYEDGVYLKNPGASTGTPNPMTDPAGMEVMMDGMKKNMAMIIPQTIIMGWVNYFFSGFVLIKLPFPLTLRFKSMLQRGINTSEMDVAWVSSLSWYFLNLFGLRSIFNIILGEDNAMGGMGMAMGQPGQPQDFSKLFADEKDNLELTVHRWELHNVEKRILKKYRA